MQKNKTILGALLLGVTLLFTGCGDSSDDTTNNTAGAFLAEELEQDAKVLIFYSASTNEHVAFDVDHSALINLNTNTEYANFQMEAGEEGKLFIWLDDKGDTNTSNDEEKVVMMSQDYDYATDGNITWEDFYYLGHFHEEEENGVEYHELAAHLNSEFDLSSLNESEKLASPKYKALLRLNAFIKEQETTHTTLEGKLNTLPSGAVSLCGFKTIENDSGVRHYAMGTDGMLYVYREDFSLLDTTQVSSSCSVNGLGISSVSHEDENGVVVFEANSQKVYLVDSHDGGLYHVHSSWSVSEIIGARSVEMMVSLAPLEEDHEH